jgi:hypothetical protein
MLHNIRVAEDVNAYRKWVTTTVKTTTYASLLNMLDINTSLDTTLLHLVCCIQTCCNIPTPQ